ncbi:hypothetical protein [Sulfuricurvum sp.]|uniref:terminase small subunit-like protein n=1 Tax=Sulfuricurvum sp. TaxID=2025608 RepID=UPI003561894E
MPEQEEQKKNTGGRPSKFSQEIADEICKRLSSGESLLNICRDDHLPTRISVYNWLLDGKHEAFFNNYARARELQAEYLFDDCLDIADDGTNDWMIIHKRSGEEEEVPNREVLDRSRLRVDTRKWYLSKVLPKKFGEQKTGNVNVIINISERIKEARSRIDPALRVFSERET